MKIIYYVNDADSYTPSFKNVLQNNVEDFVCEYDFTHMLETIRMSVVDIIVMDYVEYKKYQKVLNMFIQSSGYYIPMIIIAGNIEQEFSMKMPYNYVYMKYDEIIDNLEALEENIKYIRLSEKNLNFEMDNKTIIYNCLIDLGFKFRSRGIKYLMEAINYNMVHDCKPCNFHNTIYLSMSKDVNTSVNNIVRCIQSSIDTVWSKKQFIKENIVKYDIDLNEFEKKPTPKEFICYIANKLYNYKHRKMIANSWKES